MKRGEAITHVARDLARWQGFTGPQALRAARQAISTLEVEGYITFALDDETGKEG